MDIVDPKCFQATNWKYVWISVPGETKQPFAIPLLAGMGARVFSVTVVSPLELIRTKMQSQRLSYYGI